jgi:hypothetical protein
MQLQGSGEQTPFHLVSLDLFGRGRFLTFHFGYGKILGGVPCHMVEDDVVLENSRDLMFFVNRLPWALPRASTAIDAFVRTDVELIGEFILISSDVFINTIDGANVNASFVKMVNAETSYRPSHTRTISHLCILLFERSNLTGPGTTIYTD